MIRSLEWLALLGVLGLLGLPAAGRVAAQAPDGPVTIEHGDLHVQVLQVQRVARLVGDILRSPNDNYLVLRLFCRAAPGKELRVHPRATFAVLSGGADAAAPVKYPVTLIGYFQPPHTRPVKNQEAITVDEKGAGFSIAAEVPKAETLFRLALQRPVAEVVVGRPRSLNEPLPLKPLGESSWQGRVTRGGVQENVFRTIPGSRQVDTLKPRRNIFFDLGLEFANTGKEPRALTVADLVIFDETEKRQMGPIGVLGGTGRTATAIAPAATLPPQGKGEPLRAVWDVTRTENYTLQLYGMAAQAPLPTGAALSELTVDTAEGHLMAGEEHRLLGRLEKALDEYRIVLQKFADSDAAIEAEARMADVEVGIILGQKFLPLPPGAEGVRGNVGNQAELAIENGTEYNLVVFYSGPSSKKVELKAHEVKTIQLTRGKYKVAARGDAPNVLPFAGERSFQAGYIYQIRWIIVSRGGGG